MDLSHFTQSNYIMKIILGGLLPINYAHYTYMVPKSPDWENKWDSDVHTHVLYTHHKVLTSGHIKVVEDRRIIV